MSPTSPSVLILSMPTLPLASSLAETYLLHPLPPPDLIIALGPFTTSEPQANNIIPTPEQTAASIGTVTSVLSQLENIVCRLLYLPSHQDPFGLIGSTDDLRLTPNSRNILNRSLSITPQIQIHGHTQNVTLDKSPLTSACYDIDDSDDDSDYDTYSQIITSLSSNLTSIIVVNLRSCEADHQIHQIPARILSLLKSDECQEKVKLVILNGDKKLDCKVGNVRVVVAGVMGVGDFAVVKFEEDGEVTDVDFKQFN